MKRYLAFFFNTYYPSGGMDDLLGEYDSSDEAKSAIIEKAISEIRYYGNDEGDIKDAMDCKHAHVYDTETRIDTDLTLDLREGII